MHFDSDDKLYATIGKNIKKYRNKANITQIELCETTGISLSYLTKLESVKCDKSISLSCLNILANALDVSITAFFESSE